eukprot:7402913-Lingulodinium_polyedra.AAC.1
MSARALAEFSSTMQVRETQVVNPFYDRPTRDLYCADRRISLQYLGEFSLVCGLPADATDLQLDELRCIVDTCAAF